MSETPAPLDLPPAPVPALPAEPRVILLADAGVLALAGEDRAAFLQGLVSNDVSAATPDKALWSAFLTPQGKYLHDFFIAAAGDRLLLVCEAARRDDLFRRLRMYKLRSRVELTDVTGQMAVVLAYGAGAPSAFDLPALAGAARGDGERTEFVDPRLPELGVRAVMPAASLDGVLAGHAAGHFAEWDRLRIALGVPDGSRDLVPDKSILLENGFDELNGLSWTKGCYMGQELTARTKYRGLVKKRLMPVLIEGAVPPPGTPLMANGREAGELRSAVEGIGLALVRLEAAAAGTSLEADGTRFTPCKPGWARF